MRIDQPKPQAGQVLVKVHTAALNFPDILLIAGKYQVKPPLPFTPGLEVAGNHCVGRRGAPTNSRSASASWLRWIWAASPNTPSRK